MATVAANCFENIEQQLTKDAALAAQWGIFIPWMQIFNYFSNILQELMRTIFQRVLLLENILEN